jgi:dTMP kinase
MTSKAGFFLSFEGGEACGKSTQIRLLVEKWRAMGRNVLAVREPGGTGVGEQIRHILQFAKESSAMTPEAELLLFAASRSQLVREVIRPALAAGTIVISDRFHDSTTVYQGVARRLDPAQVAAINDFAVGGCVPDATVLLDLPVDTAAARLRARGGEPDRMEAQPEAFHQAVREGYLALAAKESGRFVTVDGAGTPDEIHAAIVAALERKWHGLFA